MNFRFRRLTAAIALMGAGVYATLTLITTGPSNPIKIAVSPGINSMYTPYFLQNWQLFAPDPLAQERGILVQARCSDGDETQFEDITTDLVTDLQSTRFFPSREHRVITTAIARRFETDEVVKKILDKDSTKSGREDVDRYAQDLNERNVRASEQILAEYAMRKINPSTCDGDMESIRVRYVLHDYPGWSDRRNWEKQGNIITIDSGWFHV